MQDESIEGSVFKIRNPKTGLFSNGGSRPSFTKKGKTWGQLSHVSTHLGYITPETYRDCELVELSYVIKKRTPIRDLVDAKRLKDREKELKRKQMLSEIQEERERTLLKQLKEKYKE